MNLAETGKLLAKVQLYDNRTVDRATIEAWHEVIGHLDFQVALQALKIHKMTSTDYLQPAHIVMNARKAREASELDDRRRRAIAPSEHGNPEDYRRGPELLARFAAMFGNPSVARRDHSRAAEESERSRQMEALRERMKDGPE